VDAKRLEETELAEAKAQARGIAGAEADSRMREFFGEEEERVAGAIAFLELLLPELSERVAALKPALAAPRAARPAVAGSSGKERGVADFIDEMLAQDRAGSH